MCREEASKVHAHNHTRAMRARARIACVRSCASLRTRMRACLCVCAMCACAMRGRACVHALRACDCVRARSTLTRGSQHIDPRIRKSVTRDRSTLTRGSLLGSTNSAHSTTTLTQHCALVKPSTFRRRRQGLKYFTSFAFLLHHGAKSP